ncbi:TraR/DksA C4-type zinc finger protein [bacterium]|nr:TraR/DksA C4-type zinc finger protein [bacterium]
MLTPEQKAELRTLIEAQLVEIEQEIARLEELVKPIPLENSIGRISRMEAINSKSINEAGLRMAKERQIDLRNALSRMEEENFGLCVRCGNPIPFKRILLMPETRNCVHCAA